MGDDVSDRGRGGRAVTGRLPSRDRFLCEEMLRHLSMIEGGAKVGRMGLQTDITTRYAVEHATELLAEAAKRTSAVFKAENPGVPWRALSHLRVEVAHPCDVGGEPINVDRLWRFLRDEAPAIARRLRRAKFPR